MTSDVMLAGRSPVLVVGENTAAIRAVAVLAANGVDARLVSCEVTGGVAPARAMDDPAPSAVASLIGPHDGERISVAGGATMRVLDTGHITEHRLGITELTVPSGGAPAPLHRHSAHDEGFYVIAGSVRFFLGAGHQDAGPGTFVMVPPGVDHGFANIGGSDAVLLNTFTPDLYIDFFRQMAALRDNGDTPTPERAIEIMRRYATEPTTDASHPEHRHHPFS